MDDAGCYERLLVDPAVRTLLGTFYGAMAWKTSTQPFIREVTPALIHTLSNPPAALVARRTTRRKG